jgi:hypothetical protein
MIVHTPFSLSSLFPNLEADQRPRARSEPALDPSAHMSMNLVGDPFKVFPAWSRSAALCEPCVERFQSWHFEPYDHEGIKRGAEPLTLSYSVNREGLASSVTFGCPLCKMFMETMRLKPEARSLDIKYQMLNTNPQKDPSNIDLLRVEESWLGAAGKKHRTAYDFWMHAARGKVITHA